MKEWRRQIFLLVSTAPESLGPFTYLEAKAASRWNSQDVEVEMEVGRDAPSGSRELISTGHCPVPACWEMGI